MRAPVSHTVTFITPTQQYDIRLTCSNLDMICDAARACNARYFVAADGGDDAQGCPIWGVFDMRTADRNNPTPGSWTIRDPIKTFTTRTPDGAVMWALSKREG